MDRRGHAPATGRRPEGLSLDAAPDPQDGSRPCSTTPAICSRTPRWPAFLDAASRDQAQPAVFLREYAPRHGYNGPRLTPQDRAIDMWRDTIQGVTIGTVVLIIASGLVWLIKTLVDHRRWSRLSKIQTDVHTKILDRFSSNEDLLAYIQTPAGRGSSSSRARSASTHRARHCRAARWILWSAQAGAVLTVLGLGLTLVSRTTLEEVAPPLAALGAVTIALGVGFLVSAVPRVRADPPLQADAGSGRHPGVPWLRRHSSTSGGSMATPSTPTPRT